MKYKVSEIAKAIDGIVIGNDMIEITKIATIENGEIGAISFLGNPKYTQYIYVTDASAVIVDDNFNITEPIKCTLIKVKNVYQSLSKLLNLFDNSDKNRIGISGFSIIDPTATIGKHCYIGNHVSIGKNVIIEDYSKIYSNVSIENNVKIGENTVIYSGVSIYYNCVIGKNCTLHSGVIVGADGFGFTPNTANEYLKVFQIGNVIIEDNVEIGANTTIDRATIGATIIGKGVKLDNLIQIAHNVEIGENTVVAAQVGIAGSSKIGKNCMIGGQVGISGHINIGNNVRIAAQSGIVNNIPDNSTVMGSPAFDLLAYKKSYIHFKNLNKIVKEFDSVKKQNNK